MEDSEQRRDESPNGRDPRAGTPLWVKVFAAIGFVLVVLLVVAFLIGEGHGPGRHGLSGQVPKAVVSVL